MGIQTMAFQSNGQETHFQPLPLTRQNSWYSLTLNEVKNRLEDIRKPLFSVNLDECLQNIWAAETNQSMRMDAEITSSVSSLQQQASLTLARALSGKTIDEVRRDILLGQKRRYGEVMKSQDREPKLGETTVEDFLVQAGRFAETYLNHSLRLDSIEVENPQNIPQKVSLSSSSSVDSLSDTTMLGRKRDALDTFETTIERRLKRKIKNRESAARSRARKQVILFNIFGCFLDIIYNKLFSFCY